MTKKSLPILIFSVLLSLAFCQAGLADPQDIGISKDFTLLQQWEKSTSVSAFLLFDENDFGLVHFPFTRTARIIAYHDLRTFYPLVNAVLSARDLLWTEIAKWNPTPSFSGTACYEAVPDTFQHAFDANNLATEDRMAISLRHGVGKKRAWNVSLDLGIAIQNDYNIEPGDAVSDRLFPRLGMNLDNQDEGILNQLRSATPFIGIGISCRF